MIENQQRRIHPGLSFYRRSDQIAAVKLCAGATLASQFFIIWMIDKFGWFKNYDTSGIITAQDVVIFGREFTSPLEMYIVVLVTVTVLTILAINKTRGSSGRNWMAVRDMDIAAESMGISLLRTKLQAFAISAFF